MSQWIGAVATVATALVALAALIVSILTRLRVAQQGEFKLLLQRIDQEAAKREKAFEREIAKREAETRAIIERFEKEAAKRDDRFEREAAKREEAIRAVMDRSDRKFEALQKRSDELYRQSAEITVRVAHTEAILETAAEANPATGQNDAVAAQDVPGSQTSE